MQDAIGVGHLAPEIEIVTIGLGVDMFVLDPGRFGDGGRAGCTVPNQADAAPP